jgi:CubicO group peptidase (beta-lactamase class C family)
MRERVFLPAGMSSTYLIGDQVPDSVDVAHGSIGDRDVGSPADWAGPAWAHLGGGGVLSNLRDLGAWDRALAAGGFLGDDARSRMVRPWIRTRGGFYGFGLRISETDYGGPLVWHAGSESNGFEASFLRFVDRGLTIVVMTNHSEEETGFAHPTAVNLARRLLEPGYRETPPYVEDQDP